MELSTEILIMLFLLESGLTTLIGVVAGLVLKWMSVEDYMTNLSNHFVRLFMILLLPPIIFESGYNMQKGPFFKNIGSILMYSFIGTFIAILSSSLMFYIAGLTPLSPHFTVRESLAFGALISSTDPVSVLALFKEMDADVTIHYLIFGESIFNDAITIVMYNTVTEIGKGEGSYSNEVMASIGKFFLVFMGSVMIGAISALLIAFILKRQSSF
jgi:NhaP-type Na+/H+ or K+/H+ antiporter